MTVTDTRLFVSRDNPTDTLPSGLRRRKLGRSPEIDLTQYFYEAGMSPGEAGHSHSFSTAVFIVSGRFQLDYGSESRILTPGDSYVAMVGDEHKVTCLESGSYVVAKPAATATPKSIEELAHEHDHDHEHSHSH